MSWHNREIVKCSQSRCVTPPSLVCFPNKIASNPRMLIRFEYVVTHLSFSWQGPTGPVRRCPLFRVDRKSCFGPDTSGFDLGCVKTLTFNLRVEFSSRFRQCGNQLHWQLL